MNYKTLEEGIANWAKEQDPIRAVVVIGSRAREDHTADAWSDLDLMLFVTDQQLYVKDTSWLATFGEVWLRALNFSGAGDPEWLVLYEDGVKVDFLLAPATGKLVDILFGSFYAVAAQRGVRVLLDKQGDSGLRAPRLTDEGGWVKPEQEVFTAVLDRFWLSAFRAATMLRRGDLWRARAITDGPMRQYLVQMLEWHAKAERGEDFDTWYDGRFLEEWADARVLATLPVIFATFDQADTYRALLASIAMMDWLGRETAENWQYHYPHATESRIHEWIEALLPVFSIL